MGKLRFDGKVVLITGGSRGLGRAFALQFARLGAKVVVNSLGGADENQPERSAAEVTLQEIEKAGGEGAIIDCPVSNAARIIDFCQATFGRLDVVVHSAGIVKDVRLSNSSDQDWQAVIEANLDAAFNLSRTAWPLFVEQGAGRLLFIGSSAGLYGNFGQANYSAAKAGLVGLAETIAQEGAKHNIHANVVAPVAITRMNRRVLPAQDHDKLNVESVAPVAAWLCHAACNDNGSVYETAGGWVGKVRWQRSAGFMIPDDGRKRSQAKPQLTEEQGQENRNEVDSIDDIADHWAEASDFSQSGTTYPVSALDSLQKILARLS